MKSHAALKHLRLQIPLFFLLGFSIQASAVSTEYSPHSNLILTDVKPEVMLVVGDERITASTKALQESLKRAAREGDLRFSKVHVDQLDVTRTEPPHVVFISGLSNYRLQQLEEKIRAGLMIDVDHWLGEDAYSPGWSVTVPGGSESGGYGANGDLNWWDFSLPFGRGSWGIPDLGDPFSRWTDIDWEDFLEPRDIEGDFGKRGSDVCNIQIWFIEDSAGNHYPVTSKSKIGCGDIQEIDFGTYGWLSVEGKGGSIGGNVALPCGGNTKFNGKRKVEVRWTNTPQKKGKGSRITAIESATVILHGKEKKKPKDPISGTPDSSPRSVAMQRKLLEMTQQYESKKAIDAISKGIPLEGEGDQRAADLFKQWLLKNGIELPTPHQSKSDTRLLEFRWAFFKASMEGNKDRPDLWWYLWSKGVPYDPPEPAIPTVFRTYNPSTNDFDIRVEIRSSQKSRVDAAK